MDSETAAIFDFVITVLPYVAMIVLAPIGGWVFTTWLRVRHGYPLDSTWGIPVHPKTDPESAERIKLLTNESAQLRAELGSIKDRLQNVERIVTDQPSKLAQEIEALAIDKGGHA
jgi:hypothetical protein